MDTIIISFKIKSLIILEPGVLLLEVYVITYSKLFILTILVVKTPLFCCFLFSYIMLPSASFIHI